MSPFQISIETFVTNISVIAEGCIAHNNAEYIE